MLEQTLGMIKPEGMRFEKEICKMIAAHFTIIKSKLHLLTSPQIVLFYGEHMGKPFFPKLMQQMLAGPVTALLIEGNNAIAEYRELMGATDPKNAALGTIRHAFAREFQLPQNVIHGSDSPDAARREIPFFFARIEFIP